MGLCQIKCCLVLIVCFSLAASLSGATFISDGVFGSPDFGQRRLLQAKQRCPISFEFRDYTNLTNSCKGPKYLPELCCPAFLEFVCPVVDYVNDLSTDCAATMFSYINIRGRYPPGLFSNECKGGPNGLECPAVQNDSSQSKNNSSSLGQKNTWYLLLVVSFLLLQFM